MPTWIDENLAIAPMPSEGQIPELAKTFKAVADFCSRTGINCGGYTLDIPFIVGGYCMGVWIARYLYRKQQY